jgi:hypothetical protein
MANSLRSSECSRSAQSGPFCMVQLAVAEGAAVAPNGGSRVSGRLKREPLPAWRVMASQAGRLL